MNTPRKTNCHQLMKLQGNNVFQSSLEYQCRSGQASMFRPKEEYVELTGESERCIRFRTILCGSRCRLILFLLQWFLPASVMTYVHSVHLATGPMRFTKGMAKP
jgi:hypothetical protein